MPGMPVRAPAVLLALLMLAVCSGPSAPQIPAPPPALGNGWNRERVERPPLETAPPEIRARHAREWLRASFRSSGSTVLVDVWRMPSESVAFETRQKWRNEPGSLAFHWRDLFLVCSSETESTQALSVFSAKLEAEWLATGR